MSDAPSTVADALSEAVSDVTCDLAYIRELSDALAEAAEANNPNRIEALARGVALMADTVRLSLDQHVDNARK